MRSAEASLQKLGRKKGGDCEGDEVEEVRGGWYVILAEERMVGIPYAPGEAS